MVRVIERTYTLTPRDVNEAIVAWLKAKNLPEPEYVGSAGTTKWTRLDDGSVKVEWIEKDELP